MLVFLLAALENDEDKKLFTEIYEQYRPQMERTAMHFLKSHADIEDAVQNAFMQMIRHFEKIYEIPCEELSFWIISIVKNEALMIIRKSQKTVPLEDWDGLVRESENKAKIWEAFEHAILDSGLAVCMTSIQGMRGLPIIPWQSSVHKDLTQRLIRKQRLFPKQTLSVRLRFGVYKNCMFSKNKIIQCN